MSYLQNLHTHSTYCDGKDTPEEIINAALDMGFDSVGFSSHSYMHYSPASVKIGDKIKMFSVMQKIK